MTSSFVPFIPAAKTAARSSVQHAFAPLVSNSSQTAAEHPASALSAMTLASESAVAPASTEPCAPKVTVQREADRITRIQIHCSCGELIEVDCQY
jgi:hypothetical protein